MSNVPLTIEADDQNEVAVLIDGDRFKFWDSASIKLSMESLTQFTLAGLFESDNAIFRNAFRPATYKDITLYVGGELVKQCTMVQPNPTLGPENNSVSVNAYGKAGIINDCNKNITQYPLEFYNRNIQQLATIITGGFDLEPPVFTVDPGAVFDSVSLGVSDNPLKWLSKLAQQRGILISDDTEGRLLFQVANEGSPIAALNQGVPPMFTGTANYSGQELFSSVSGQAPTFVGLDAEQVTREVDFVGAERPYVFKMEDSAGADLQGAVLAKTGLMLGKAISWGITLQGWRDPNGDIWKPNQIIKMTAPGLMVYNASELLIKDVVLTRTPTKDTTVMKLVLPGAYSGKIPEVLPWED